MTTTVKKQRTTSKEVRNKIRNYVLECINAEGYDVPQPTTDAEKIAFLIDTFHKEYCYSQNLTRYGSYQETFVNWCMGLPSAFNCDFENYKIMELVRSWGWVNEQTTVKGREREEQKVLENYWRLLWREVAHLARVNKINIY